jgi:prolyl-tRNA synthetase
MKLSQNFTKTIREAPADETAKNAQLLIRAGYVHKTMAGVYSYLPLGLRMINKIENIVRKNLNAIGGQEILMNSLHPKEWWVTTNRWENVDILFKVKSQTDKEYAIACSHEEQVTPILSTYINSWKDLQEYNAETQTYPTAVYQIQTKFRDELRSRSGVMRGREFRMKDMYDFHRSKESADNYYELVKATYHKIYQEMGLKAYVVHASGGIFTSNDSHEFQVICEAGEDEIFYDEKTGYAINSEIIEGMKAAGQAIPEGLTKAVSAEVGNIFKLDDKYTKAFGLTYTDQDNKPQYPIMNCHGIGTSRTMGVICEIYSDEKGLKLPAAVAPFEIHLVTGINEKADAEVNNKILDIANRIYNGELKLIKTPRGKYILLDTTNTAQLLEIAKEDSTFDLSQLSKFDDILWDDRTGKISIGEKLKDADLIGCPIQILISKKSLENGGLELIIRESGEGYTIRLT